MVPGMGHCAGGPGPNEFGAFRDPPVADADHDILRALERWVEQGIAPEKIVATHFVNGNPAGGIQFQTAAMSRSRRPRTTMGRAILPTLTASSVVTESHEL